MKSNVTILSLCLTVLVLGSCGASSSQGIIDESPAVESAPRVSLSDLEHAVDEVNHKYERTLKELIAAANEGQDEQTQSYPQLPSSDPETEALRQESQERANAANNRLISYQHQGDASTVSVLFLYAQLRLLSSSEMARLTSYYNYFIQNECSGQDISARTKCMQRGNDAVTAQTNVLMNQARLAIDESVSPYYTRK